MRRHDFAKHGLALGLSVCAVTTAIAAAVYGAIGDKYNVLGRENGPLGAALIDEASAPHGGRFNEFRNGFIYWHADVGAFAVWGAIAAKWNQLGRVEYGYPITDESKTPDRRGRFNHFRAVQLPGKPESSIYWTPQTGAVAIYGAIREKWAAEGWERGRMGYPTGDEIADGPYRRSTFERGFIRWTSTGGPQVIPTSLAPYEGGGSSGKVVNGIAVHADLPTGAHAELYRDPTLLSHVELCARFLDQPGLNDTLRNTLISRIPPKLPSGFRIHSQSNHAMGASCEARAELSSHSVSILIRVPGNRLFVRVTTPDGIPGSLDPNFAVTYDLIVRTSITFPDTVAGSVVQGPVTVQGTNVSRPESRSVTGKLVIAVNDISSFLGGPDFFGAVRQGGVAQMSGVNTGTALLNLKLAQLRNGAPAGTRLELYPQDSLVAVLATNRIGANSLVSERLNAVEDHRAALAAVSAADLEQLRARGELLANSDALTRELRNRTAAGALRRGFDIGMGIWASNTAPGPGKQRVHDVLSASEQPGYDIAAAFSLPRNKYATLAIVGAAIGNADPAVAAARNAEDDVFFWLGFDIASGIFGDPTAGSLGNTATGPGSLGIRNELNAPGQRGFDAATALHLSRKYR